MVKWAMRFLSDYSNTRRYMQEIIPSNVNGGGTDNLGYPFNKIYQNGIAPSQPANSKLKWETDKQTDIGIDAAFMNGALTFTADWFNRDSKDFLLRLDSSCSNRASNSLTRNVGKHEQ